MRGRDVRCVLLITSVALAGCSGQEPPDPAAAVRDQIAAAGQAAAASQKRCPLSADQVGAALGAPMKEPDPSCSFYPADDRLMPNAGFNWQFVQVCAGNVPADDRYRERLEGLGVPAFVADMGDGTWVLVCSERSPFEIRVDAQSTEDARQFAMTLAREVLEASQ